MKINENLLLAYGNHNNTSTVLPYTTSAIAPIVKGEQYTISYVVEKSNRFGVYTDTLSNGIFKPYIDATEVSNWRLTTIGEKIKYTFTADKDGYVIFYLSNGNGDTKETYFKIEKGDTSTPYIPSKNMLEPSKQAVFVAGGGIQGSVSTLSLKLVEIDQLSQGVGYVS